MHMNSHALMKRYLIQVCLIAYSGVPILFWVACSDGAVTPLPHEAVTERAGDKNVQVSAPLRTPSSTTGAQSGSAAMAGPSRSRLVGWRAKGDDTQELGLAESSEAEFAASVTALVGYDPFSLATAAGPVPTSRGVARDLNDALAVSRSTSDKIIAVMIPTVPAQLGVEATLVQRGATILDMLPPNAYVLKADIAALTQLGSDPLVHWLGRIPWDRKIDPLLARELKVPGVTRVGPQEKVAVEPDTIVVTIYDHADRERVQHALEATGSQVERFDDAIKAFITVGLDAQTVVTMAKMPEVSYVEARLLHTLHMETSMDYCGNHDDIRDTYSYGDGVTIGMIDSGFEIDHEAFMGWSSYPVLYARAWNVSGEGSFWDDNPSGHGTHVAGTLLSRWYYENLDGTAPRSGGDANHRFRVVRTGKDSGDPTTVYNTGQAMGILANDNGAEVINCSWGNDSNTGTNSSAVKADATIWQTKQTYVFSAGNSGPASGSIGSPAAAKNVIAVGNVNNGTLGLESDSSEGPTADGRTKPDIYAPGRWVTSADAEDLDDSVDFGGTSMAAPHVTGVLATLMDHYSTLKRHPATAKAYLMATASRKNWLPTRTGVLNSYDAHFASSNTKGHWGWRDSDPRPYDYTYWDFDIPSGVDEMFVVLSWIEPAAAVGASRATYNDVDLWVDHGRDDGSYGEWGSFAVSDNVEFVRIVNPPAGPYRFKAYNYSVSRDYRPGLGIFYRK